MQCILPWSGRGGFRDGPYPNAYVGGPPARRFVFHWPCIYHAFNWCEVQWSCNFNIVSERGLLYSLQWYNLRQCAGMGWCHTSNSLWNSRTMFYLEKLSVGKIYIFYGCFSFCFLTFTFRAPSGCCKNQKRNWIVLVVMSYFTSSEDQEQLVVLGFVLQYMSCLVKYLWSWDSLQVRRVQVGVYHNTKEGLLWAAQGRWMVRTSELGRRECGIVSCYLRLGYSNSFQKEMGGMFLVFCFGVRSDSAMADLDWHHLSSGCVRSTTLQNWRSS